MAKMKLTLIKTKSGLLLEGRAPGKELEFYDVDGEGGKATKISFAPWNEDYKPVAGVKTATYDSEDTDSFWSALSIVLNSAKKKVTLPDYAAV
jgi:hypothetical protein